MRAAPDHKRRTCRRARLVLAILSCVAVSLAFTAQAPLTLVSTAWAPFTNPDGQPRFALDLVETAFDRIGIAATTTIVDASQFTASLLSPRVRRQSRGVEGCRARTRRSSSLNPTSRIGSCWSGSAAPTCRPATLADLAGKRVAIVEGYAYRRLGRERRAGLRAMVERGRQPRAAALAARGGLHLDGRPGGPVSRSTTTRRKPGRGCRSARRRWSSASCSCAIRRTRPDAESIVTRFNAQLRGMIADGTSPSPPARGLDSRRHQWRRR